MNHRKPAATPIRAILLWILAALAGAGGLILAHGFNHAVIPNADQMARLALGSCLGLFALSRLLMLFPAHGLQTRLNRWWVDYVLLIAAAIWWCLKPESEYVILRVGAAYTLAVGAAAVVRAMFGGLTDVAGCRSVRMMAGGLACLALTTILIGGSLLSLPVCQRAPQAVESDHPLAAYQLWMAWADSTFTAAAAFTGTGLTVQDIGYHYNRLGQLIILVLIQAGGLGVLAIGTIIGLQFRHMLGWGGVDDDLSPRGLRRALLFVCVFALAVEAVGAVGVYRMWDPEADLNYATAMHEPGLLGPLVANNNATWGQRYDEARLFASVFHSVSAFCGSGLMLTRDGYMAYRQVPAPYLALMPLMLMGSLGGPVVYELCKRMMRRRGAGLEAISWDTLMTLGGSVAVILMGAGLLVGIESTRDWQKRYPRNSTPGRLMLGEAHAAAASGPAVNAETGVIDFAGITTGRAQAERISGMPLAEKMQAALFQAEAARAGGVRSVRLDENSLSPSSHLVMIGLMLVGGGVGGTSGGLRIVIIALLIAAVFTGGHPVRMSRDARMGKRSRARGTAMATAMLASMMLLIGLVFLLLIFREAGSPLACAFEAVSACCNVGLSLGITAELSLMGRVTLMAGMLLGRLVPIIILMRCLLPTPLDQPKARPTPEVAPGLLVPETWLSDAPSSKSNS